MINTYDMVNFNWLLMLILPPKTSLMERNFAISSLIHFSKFSLESSIYHLADYYTCVAFSQLYSLLN